MNFTFYSHFSPLVRSIGIESAAKAAAELGFSGVEPLELYSPDREPLFPTVEAAKEAQKILEAYGLHASCYSVGTGLYKNPNAAENLKHHAELAAALGSPYLHHTLGGALTLNEDSPTTEEFFADVIPRAIEVARTAESLGISCIYEDQGMYVNGIDNFASFFGGVSDEVKSVGVCADMGNSLFVDTPPLDFIKAFIKDVKHVHVKDYRVLGKKPDEIRSYITKGGSYLVDTVPGSGASRVAECARCLLDFGYTGDWAFEPEGAGYPEPFVDVAKSTMRLLREIGE